MYSFLDQFFLHILGLSPPGLVDLDVRDILKRKQKQGNYDNVL